MDIQTIILASLIFNAIVLIWFIFTIKSNKPKIDTQEITQQISENFNQKQDSSNKNLFSFLNEQNNNSNSTLSKHLQSLEERFGQVQLKLSQGIAENLEKIQESVIKRVQEGLKSVQENNHNNFQFLNKANQDKLSQIQLEVEKRLDENLARNLKAFGDVRENLGQMQNTAQRMIDSTKSVDKLNSIFERTASKSFGNFGEKYLESLLSENLSEKSWASQVAIPGTSDKIDFMVEMDGKRIGIDSKFPLTKYRDYIDADTERKPQIYKEFLKQVADMAKSIAEKYNKQGFFNVLLIYLPSDSMYLEVVNNEQLSSYLTKVGVTPTSPNTIFPIITTLSAYQQRLQVSENAENIIRGLQIVRRHMEAFSDEFRKLGDKLRTAQDNYTKAEKSLTIVDREVLQLESLDHKES